MNRENQIQGECWGTMREERGRINYVTTFLLQTFKVISFMEKRPLPPSLGIIQD